MSTSVPGNLISLSGSSLEDIADPIEKDARIGTFPQHYTSAPPLAPFRAVLLASVAGALLWVLLFKVAIFAMHLF